MKKGLTIVALMLGVIFQLSGCNSSDYKKAETFLSEGNYEYARTIYQQLEETGGYKDSADKILECDYLDADAAYTNKDYARAYALFSGLSDYKNASERAKDTGYILANQFAANENYVEAVRLFSRLGEYKESTALRAECIARMMKSASVGDTVFYGGYEQDGNTENGAEPIEWVVLRKEEDRLLLLSRYIIEKMSFGYSHYWEESDIREWLNNEFYSSALSADEKLAVQEMITSDKTEDMIFLLSAEEAKLFFTSDTARIAFITDYVMDGFYDSKDSEDNIRFYEKNDGRGDWWTRSISTASNGKGVVEVESNGNVRSAGCAPDVPNAYSDRYVGVRPALCISLSGQTTKVAQNMSIFGHDSSGDLDNEIDIWSGGGNYGNSGEKCYVCNGTGYVKYYYGSSDLEAWLSGHDAYTVGPCTSCGGADK